MKYSELIKFLQNLLVGHKYALILRHSFNHKNVLTKLKCTNYFFYLIASLTQCIEPTSSGVHHSSLLDNDVYVSSSLESHHFLFWTILLLVFVQLSIARSKLQSILHISCLLLLSRGHLRLFSKKISSFLSGRLGPTFLLCKQYIKKSLFANRNVELNSWMFVWV